jgi:protoporphyrinogen/coproporphyrinogen III oxidase
MHIVIVGGGITGLAAAWELQQQDISYTLLEATNRLGGKILSEEVDGFVIDAGADSFLTTKPWALSLAQEVLPPDLIVGVNPDRRPVYVYRDGRLQRFPDGMRLIAPVDPDGLMASTLLTEAGKQRMLDEPTIPPRDDESDESLASFVRRRFGDEALEVFGEPLLAGIHVGDPEQLSVRATFPDLVELESTIGSVTTGMRDRQSSVPTRATPPTLFASVATGMAELPAAVASHLTGDLHLEQPVVTIRPDRTVELDTGKLLEADGVIVTTPAATAARLVQVVAPKSADILATFETTSSVSIALGYHTRDLNHPLEGIGFIVPRSEPVPILAATWSSSKIPGRAPGDKTLIRLFLGGPRRPEDIDLSDQDLLELAFDGLSATMGITASPIITRIYRWRDANPQYLVDHLDRVAMICSESPGWLAFAGCPYDGVGIPDSIRQGRETARSISRSCQNPITRERTSA